MNETYYDKPGPGRIMSERGSQELVRELYAQEPLKPNIKGYNLARNGWRVAGKYHQAIEKALVEYDEGRSIHKIMQDLKEVIGDG